MRLQSGIFDLDGTLLDTTPFWQGFSHELLGVPAGEPCPDIRSEFRERSAIEAARACKARFGLPQSEASLAACFEERVLGFYRDEAEAKPGVKPFLSILKMEGVWMAVATEAPRPLVEGALRHAGLLDYFRCVLTTKDLGHSKKTPHIYEAALRRLRSNKLDTMVFEDSLSAISTAKGAGFRVTAVYDPAHEQETAKIQTLADHYIKDFRELTQRHGLG